jgi:hypothetical protein
MCNNFTRKCSGISLIVYTLKLQHAVQSEPITTTTTTTMMITAIMTITMTTINTIYNATTTNLVIINHALDDNACG